MNINGIGTRLQIGKESSYGTPAVMTQDLNFISESFAEKPEQKEEDTLIGSISSKAQDIVALNAEGGFETILKPEDAVALFSLALGVGAAPVLVNGSTTAYTHTITPVDANTALPSFTATVFRKLHTKHYAGCQINSLEVSAKSADYLRASVECVVQKEGTGTLVSGLALPELKAYRFAGGSCLIDGVAFADVTSAKVKIANNITEGDQTLGSGLYKSQGQHGLREITATLETKFSAASDSLIDSHYKVGDPVSCVLKFSSPALIDAGNPHSITITIPNLLLTGGTANISGKEDIAVSLEGKALQIGADLPCTVTIVSHIDGAF